MLRPSGLLAPRNVRRGLFAIAAGGLAAGTVLALSGQSNWANLFWMVATVPVVAGLAVSIARDLLGGRMGVDAVAIVSMAVALGLGETLAGAIVAVMYAGGNLLEDFAVARAERDLKSLIDRAPRIAHRRSGTTVADVSVECVAVGDILIVRAGEVIPVDGEIASPNATIDESALTGEPIPVARLRGGPVRSGSINAGETFELRASAEAGQSTYSGIVRLVTAAQANKAPFIRMADRYALILLPVTLAMAAAAWLYSGDAVRGLAVLVSSTPCPLILAAPVAFISGVSRAARRGIMIKGGAPLEALARAHTVMLDKTGTLTVGGARLVAIETAPGENANDILYHAASLEQASHHVVASAIVMAAQVRGLKLMTPSHAKETPGSGLEGLVGEKRVKVGSYQLVCGHARPEAWALRAIRRASWRSALSVFVAIDGRLAGAILMGDELRAETPRAVQALRTSGVKRIVMVTGDRADAAETIASALDLDAVLADRMPSDKVEAVVVEQRRHPTIMIGDGINDAPALAAADVGIAMGARGASASSEAADVVVLVDRLDRVSDAVSIARRSRKIAVQSIGAGMALSGAAMVAAAFGYLSPIQGALLQEAIDVAVIVNALRALTPERPFGRAAMQHGAARALRMDHEALGRTLDRLREIADALDEAKAEAAVALIREANALIGQNIVEHERNDESIVYPRLRGFLTDGHGLAAMSRAHREILHLARLLNRLADGLRVEDADRYLVRDAQRVIEAVEALVRIHNAQEDDIYQHAAA